MIQRTPEPTNPCNSSTNVDVPLQKPNMKGSRTEMLAHQGVCHITSHQITSHTYIHTVRVYIYIHVYIYITYVRI